MGSKWKICDYLAGMSSWCWTEVFEKNEGNILIVPRAMNFLLKVLGIVSYWLPFWFYFCDDKVFCWNKLGILILSLFSKKIGRLFDCFPNCLHYSVQNQIQECCRKSWVTPDLVIWMVQKQRRRFSVWMFFNRVFWNSRNLNSCALLISQRFQYSTATLADFDAFC